MNEELEVVSIAKIGCAQGVWKGCMKWKEFGRKGQHSGTIKETKTSKGHLEGGPRLEFSLFGVCAPLR